jgi:hypothetical protein
MVLKRSHGTRGEGTFGMSPLCLKMRYSVVFELTFRSLLAALKAILSG